ncbi:hypothetical protein NLJ89_g927 [Agrocybe chaxingu]|uniref:Uncharacterized protein n=1 Tax=Agrocybe chaxingu TaxID=84603 RepID=A0A9W8N0X1_9AGAR|nr:hypothetical protein NLJ89_g927 [Agrocybe chaxingu]
MASTTQPTADDAASNSPQLIDRTDTLENKDPVFQSNLQGATETSSTIEASDKKAVEQASIEATTSSTGTVKDVQSKESIDDESDSDDSDVPHFEGGTPRGRIQGPVAGSKPKPRPK